MAREKKRGKGRSRKGTGRDPVFVELTPTVEFLQGNVSESLCDRVFAGVRTTERQRKWSLFALARFWLYVILDPPPALTPVLERARRGDPRGLLPQVAASSEAFFERCKSLDRGFFEGLYAHFIERIEPKAPMLYSGEIAHRLKKFTGVSAIDGSRMEWNAHRLKIAWEEKSVILPGCVLAVYDLFRGIATQLWFGADAGASEHTRAITTVGCLPTGTLLLGDRLYCSLRLFAELNLSESFRLFRRTKALPVRKLRRLSRSRTERGLAEDWIVEAGSEAAPMHLRMFVLKANGTTYESLSNVLDPNRLPLADAIALYPKRWRVERLFYDLKIVLKLRKLYCANPNAVAMQIFAGAMVHATFRIAQADIARRVSLSPDELSPQKLFPLLAVASIKVIEAEHFFEKTCGANPRVKLRKPSWNDLPDTVIPLRHIVVQRRSTHRIKPEYHKNRAKWMSITNFAGAEELTIAAKCRWILRGPAVLRGFFAKRCVPSESDLCQ